MLCLCCLFIEQRGQTPREYAIYWSRKSNNHSKDFTEVIRMLEGYEGL